ncbi:gastrotropin-like [Protopterus annectens]|uniref:gastrotropin-like n=1 Tax=Protopterus annectens TaxID=7888 RepID=UPI001CF9AE8E|nr:gastrotropin-like [Protopterus annectens]
MEVLSYLLPTELTRDSHMPEELAGMPADVIEKGRSFKIVTEIVQNGNSFNWSQIYPDKTMTNKFTVGQESEMHTMSGKTFKATVNMEGGKLVVDFPNYHHTAEIVGGNLVEFEVTNSDQTKLLSAATVSHFFPARKVQEESENQSVAIQPSSSST